MRVCSALLTTFVASNLFAQVQKVDLKNDLAGQKIAKLYESAVPAKGLKPLARLKEHEIRLRWQECLTQAPSVFKTQKEVRGWVAVSWLHCLDKAQAKKKDLVAVEKVLQQIEKHPDLFTQGPWALELWPAFANFQLTVLENRVSKKDKKVASDLDRFLTYQARLSPEQKSLAFQLLGDLALAKNDYSEASFLYQEAADSKDSRYLSDKIEFLRKAQNKPAVGALAKTPAEGVAEEKDLENRIQTSLKAGESVAALKDMMTLFNEYPGSPIVRRWKDKPLEIYNGISDKLAASKALSEMTDAEAHRLVDWAQSLHRRGDYIGAFTLTTKALSKNLNASSSTQALWIAGRAAHFMGKYDEALDHFTTLMRAYSGTDEASEAYFRSALIYYRKKEYSNAAGLFEKLLARKTERFDLLAQYWLVRSQEQVNKERAKVVAQELMDRYPFSYYGLRLRAEANGNKLTWPEPAEKAPVLDQKIFLVGNQKKAWKRFVELSESGWIAEATTEWNQIPVLKDAGLQVSAAQFLVSREQYMLAIRLLNSALDNDVRLRREEFIKIGYPVILDQAFQEQSKKYNIDAVMLRSLTRQESAFNLRALSTSNAMGLMQMIPPTAQEIARKLGLRIEIPDDMYRPEINIPMGSFYVSQMLDQFKGNIPFALAAYNAGPYRLKNWIEGRDDIKSLPEKGSNAVEDEIWFDELPWTETSFYVKAILRNALIYKLSQDKKILDFPVLWQDLLRKKAD